MKIEINYSNKGQAAIDLDPSTFRKVTLDTGREYDIRVRVAFKDAQEPLDLFFPKGAIGVLCSPGPFVTRVTVFHPGPDPVVLADPVAVYAALSNLFIHGEKGTGGTEEPKDHEGHMQPGETAYGM